MIASFITSFKLKNTYRVNSIIYSIKQIPLINKILPNSLYESKTLKIIGNIISILIELITIFPGKILYIFLMIIVVLSIYKTDSASTYLHLFVFLTLIGGLLKTFMFDPTKDKYYAMIIMNMNAKKYTLSNYYYNLIKTIIGFLPFTILFSLYYKLPVWIGFIIPIYVIMIKIIFSNFCLLRYKKTNIATNENLPEKFIWFVVIFLLIIAYGLPFLNITINLTIFLNIFFITIILGICSFININKFDKYKSIYKEILTDNNINIMKKESQTAVLKENVSKQINFDDGVESLKEGFAYFHELFVKRHKKILTKAIKQQIIVILIIFIIAVVFLILNQAAYKEVNSMLLTYLPYFVFIMYLLNRGTAYTQAMFMNCDHSMLTYRIYRTPKVILGLFKERLKTIIIINILPATTIGIGLMVLLFITGGTTNLMNYGVLFISIVSMSVFFSVHYLVIYYLLQPYTVSTEMKSTTYSLVQGITYIVCYYLIKVKLPTIYFGGATIIFSLLYSFISLYLAYKYASKTFKLRA
ncbi:MAG: hypothetical protein RR050_03650 [Bacilli bacterium]